MPTDGRSRTQICELTQTLGRAYIRTPIRTRTQSRTLIRTDTRTRTLGMSMDMSTSTRIVTNTDIAIMCTTMRITRV
jgi:hypothetical protein